MPRVVSPAFPGATFRLLPVRHLFRACNRVAGRAREDSGRQSMKVNRMHLCPRCGNAIAGESCPACAEAGSAKPIVKRSMMAALRTPMIVGGGLIIIGTVLVKVVAGLGKK